jgi:hypothetical protein
MQLQHAASLFQGLSEVWRLLLLLQNPCPTKPFCYKTLAPMPTHVVGLWAVDPAPLCTP